MTTNEQIIVKPLVTEKSSLQRALGVYVFDVLHAATKIDIRRAVEQLFNVKVVSVNTSNVKGRTKRIGKTAGLTKKWKKAYIRIESGQKIDMIEEIG